VNGNREREPDRAQLTRRELLAGLGLLAIGGCAGRASESALESEAETARLLDEVTGVDMHSHAAGATGRRTPAYDLAARIRSGRDDRGMSPALERRAGHAARRADRVRVMREAAAGELWRFTETRLAWFDSLVQSQGLRRALAPGDLEAAHRDRAPAIVQAIEGCQFMEGRLERIGEVHRRGVRHLQLVHFMRSDLGDNQTESPTQGGLTPLGRDVIAECNRLGIVVDVAHGTLAMVEGAARISRTPLILSHTNLASRRLDPFTRLISGEHGKLVASTGGVVGIWASPTFASLAGYVDGVVRAATPDFPQIVRLLHRKGLSDADVGKLVGGNYVRVFNQSVSR